MNGRYRSLSAYLGDDDLFSSDLSDAQLKARLGHMSRVPCQVTHVSFGLLVSKFLYWRIYASLICGFERERPEYITGQLLVEKVSKT